MCEHAPTGNTCKGQLHPGAAFRPGHPLHGTDAESGAESCFNAILGPCAENSPEQMLREIVGRSVDRNARWSKEARRAPDDKLPPKVQVRLDKRCTRRTAKCQQGVEKLVPQQVVSAPQTNTLRLLQVHRRAPVIWLARLHLQCCTNVAPSLAFSSCRTSCDLWKNLPVRAIATCKLGSAATGRKCLTCPVRTWERPASRWT